jgi:hypothetical protein
MGQAANAAYTRTKCLDEALNILDTSADSHNFGQVAFLILGCIRREDHVLDRTVELRAPGTIVPWFSKLLKD